MYVGHAYLKQTEGINFRGKVSNDILYLYSVVNPKISTDRKTINAHYILQYFIAVLKHSLYILVG
jgi:hypothetical protein